MEDIAPSLLKGIQEDFQENFDKSKLIRQLYEKVRDGTATYKEANDFALEAGEILANAYKNNLSADVLPDGRMYYNIAQRILSPTLENNYSLITEVTTQIQKTLNDASNIGINPIVPELNRDRITGLVNMVSNADSYEKVSETVEESAVNFSQSVVTDAIRKNAEFQARAGLQPKITRKLAGGCCDWCRALAGTYRYPDDVPKDLYRRHRYCRCTVEYLPGDGRVQNSHTKQWRYEDELDRIEVRKKVGYGKNLGKNVTPEYYGKATPKEGSITIEEGLNTAKHIEEINMAEFLHNMFGGDIIVLNEVNQKNVKTADFLWRKKLWDLKTVTTEKASDSAIRKGLKQIKNKPGGIILDYSNRDVSINNLLEVIDGRMRRGFEKDTDIMIILDSTTVKIYRYKK